MDDWEDEPVQNALKNTLPLKNNWDDEDVDDDDVKESWEDEDEPAPAPKVDQPPPEMPSKKAVTKSVQQPVKPAASAPLDPIEEKLRQQRLVEEADFKSTAELFSKKDNARTLENFIPKSESDFTEYAELISHKLHPYEKSFHYVGLLKAVIRLSLTSLKGTEVKEVASSVSALANEKIKSEKEATKKKTAGKKKLNVGKADEDIIHEGYDDHDDFDFM